MRKDPLELVGLVIDGAYRVESLSDEGDLSLLYKGHHLGTDAVIGIRCLNLPTTLDSALAGPFAEAFREGSRIHYKMGPGNPNFVQTIASGTTVAPSTGQEVPYEVREWLDGRTLAAFLEKRNAEWAGGWPLDEALALLEPVANGLAYEHSQ